MPTITIPKKLKKPLLTEDVAVIPRKEYETLMRSTNAILQSIVVKRSPSFRVPKRLEKFYTKVDRELTDALREYYIGKYYGPFETVEEGTRFLETYKTRRAKK